LFDANFNQSGYKEEVNKRSPTKVPVNQGKKTKKRLDHQVPFNSDVLEDEGLKGGIYSEDEDV